MRFFASAIIGCCAALAASQAFGSLVLNLRFANGATSYDISALSNGDTIVIQVWATVSGTNGTSTDEGLSSAYFGVMSNAADTAHLTGGITGSALVSPFDSIPESSAGMIGDRNADGIADWRGTTTTNFAGWPKGAPFGVLTIAGGGATGQGNGAAWDFHLGDAIFTIAAMDFTGVGGTVNVLQFQPSLLGNLGVPLNSSKAQWTEDGANKTGASGSILAGTSVTMSMSLFSAPEPGSLSLAAVGIAGVAAYAWRRKRRVALQRP